MPSLPSKARQAYRAMRSSREAPEGSAAGHSPASSSGDTTIITVNIPSNNRLKLQRREVFDFLTAEDELEPQPIHVVEHVRETQRRHGVVDKDTSHAEFAAKLGIQLEDTRDPDSGQSVLDVSESLRAYYGDPEEEAYRVFRSYLVQLSEDDDWLKSSQFVGDSVAKEFARREQLRRQATKQSDAPPLREMEVRSYAPAHAKALLDYRARKTATAVAPGSPNGTKTEPAASKPQ